MWRCDASRSATTAQELPGDLHLQWVREYPPLEPAWPDEPRMRFDVSYEPIVLGKTMFVASPRSDKVTALATDSGDERWTFYADGPVRFAPVAWQDKLYFACDDGCLYCLNARDGTLAWKFRGGPSDRKVLGNARLISTWPARGAPVIADGKVYFAAGIWPFMGTFIYALDAETGAVAWVNDGTGSTWMPQPHGGALAFASVAPQGYMVAVGDRLIVPSGRAVPAVFDRTTGEMLFFHLAENKYDGNFAASAMSSLFFNSGLFWQLQTGTPPGKISSDPIPTEDAIYAVEGDAIAAYDPSAVEEETYKDSRDREHKRLKIGTLWKVAAEVDRLWLKAGSQLIASHGKTVVGIEPPREGNDGEVAWQIEVGEEPSAVIAADGKLFMVTLGGAIACYGPTEVEPREYPLEQASPPAEDVWTTRAAEIIQRTDVRAGYCLCLGVGGGRLMEELARQSELRIIGVDPDPAKVQRLRERFDAAGLYGPRIALLPGDPLATKLPPYLASLIVSEDPEAAGLKAGQAFVEKAFYSLRPYGGVACLPVPGARQAAFAKWVAQAKLTNANVQRAGEFTLLTREGALPGSGSWTQQYGDPSNTGVSKDSLVKAPLGLLWFGGSSNVSILPRHGHGPPEQIVGGRLFIEGPNSIRANDVYTGRPIWERELPGLGKPYNRTSHQPGANSLGTNYASTADGIYVAYGQKCLRLDPATGETLSEFTLPPAAGKTEPQTWGFIAAYDDLLIAGASPVIFEGDKPLGVQDNWDATSSKQIVVMDRHSGKVLWTYDSEYCFRHNAICAGGEKLFCIDRLPDAIVEKMQRRGEQPKAEPKLAALDLRSGKVIWSTTENVFGTWLSYSEQYDLLLQAGRPSRDMLSHEPGDRMIAYHAADGSIAWDQAHKYGGPPLLHGDTIITQGQAFSLLDGERKMRRNPLTGLEAPWDFKRMYGCNTAIASEYLLTFRSGAAGFFDLADDGGTGNLGGFKSGCTSNLIVADGVLNAPDYTRTCICSYQNQTSLAFVHMPEVEVWTFNSLPAAEGRIVRLGLNLGAPGDRKADNGTLWLDYPSVGGPSPDPKVSIEPDEPRWFRRHSSVMQGTEHNWVGASGSEGLTKLAVTLAEGAEDERPYTVTLYFAEPEDLAPGKRVFDVALQGTQVLKNFDIVGEAGGARRLVTKQFEGVKVKEALTVTLTPTGSAAPVLCGIEMVAQD